MGKKSDFKKNIQILMHKYLLYTFIIIFTFTSVDAETINEIKISGNERISNETIKLYGEIEVNKNYTETDLNKILKNLYETSFFEDVKHVKITEPIAPE